MIKETKQKVWKRQILKIAFAVTVMKRREVEMIWFSHNEPEIHS